MDHQAFAQLMYCNVGGTTQMAFNQGHIDSDLYTSVCKDVGVALKRWPRMRPQVERWLEHYPEYRTYDIFRQLEST